MKRAFIFLVAMMTLLVSCEREIEISPSEVPTPAITELNTRYPDASVVKWIAAKEKGHFYFEAKFKSGQENKIVHFTTTGGFVEEKK
jgi:hypothetical protein